MRTTLVVIIALLLSVAGLRWLSERPPEPAAGGPDPDPSGPVEPSPVDLGDLPLPGLPGASGEECATGCAVGNHPVTPLTEGAYGGLLERLATATGPDRTAALETLLFHGSQVRKLIGTLGLDPLAAGSAEFLRRELSRTHARVWLRLVDEHGRVRASVEGARFPVGKKEHVHATSTRDLPPPEISGTVHRTGLHHLWTRI